MFYTLTGSKEQLVQAATVMVHIQQRVVREHTGLDDADAYRELAAILTGGIEA